MEQAFEDKCRSDPYMADFVCHSANLVVEIDGGQHFEARGLRYDARRDAFVASKGFRILRFSNLDVMQNCLGVLEMIAAAIASAPPHPSPAGGGGSRPPAPLDRHEGRYAFSSTSRTGVSGVRPPRRRAKVSVAALLPVAGDRALGVDVPALRPVAERVAVPGRLRRQRRQSELVPDLARARSM